MQKSVYFRDFFFVTGQIYVDKKSTSAIRGQAQGFYVLVTLGAGMLIGAVVTGVLFNNIVNEAAEAMKQWVWQLFWLIPAVLAGVVLLVFTLLFNDKETVSKTTET